ncbi:hairy-related 3 [Pseudorasbora parva]|uniref:hairy-related 3 n=1 Tax=Pseudorasbora parva TaxID=51549 RepID=UPI00351E57AB
MAAASDSVVTAKTQFVKKVSKPLMEKKRRARINKCLNQLKSLLESVCSNNIRKRKLEKADILELTVKHLRHLQNSERGIQTTVCDSAEYHTGYRSCLTSVSRFLLASDTDRDSRFTMLTNLTSDSHHTRVPDFTAESDRAPILPPSTLQRSHSVSLKTDAPYSNLQQTCFMPKMTEVCDMNKISFDTQVGASGSKKLKSIHFSLKNTKVDECCSLKQNYWRPW